jgi:hypothetical protein
MEAAAPVLICWYAKVAAESPKTSDTAITSNTRFFILFTSLIWIKKTVQPGAIPPWHFKKRFLKEFSKS